MSHLKGLIHGCAVLHMKGLTCSTLLADTSMSVLTMMRQANTCTLYLATLAGTKTCRHGQAGVGDHLPYVLMVVTDANSVLHDAWH